MQRRDLAKFFHLGRAEIAHADGANLSRAVQFTHGFRDLRKRRMRIRPMDLIQIDDIGLQTAQGILGFLDDPRLAGVTKRLSVLPVESDLGGDERALAPATRGQRLTDDFLRTPEAVDRRGIDQIDSAIQRGMDCVDSIALVAASPHPAADRPCSKRDTRNSHRGAGNIDEFHVGLTRLVAAHGSTPAPGAAQSIERVTAFDGILASDAIKMVSQRGDSIKKGFMVRTSSSTGLSLRTRSFSTNLESGHHETLILDQMRDLLGT